MEALAIHWTGRWLIYNGDFGDEYPNAEVIGTDLSPMQVNCKPLCIFNLTTADFCSIKAGLGSPECQVRGRRCDPAVDLARQLVRLRAHALPQRRHKGLAAAIPTGLPKLPTRRLHRVRRIRSPVLL